MRFHRPLPVPPTPWESKRSRLVFAWRPVRIGEFLVWLERYELVELFRCAHDTAEECRLLYQYSKCPHTPRWCTFARRLCIPPARIFRRRLRAKAGKP